jgi:hypothetical protein
LQGTGVLGEKEFEVKFIICEEEVLKQQVWRSPRNDELIIVR